MTNQKVYDYFFKVIWTKSFIAIAVDKCYKSKKIPLTTFYFWPREDGWKLLEKELESKPWIPEKDKISILNDYTNLINAWINRLNGNLNTFPKSNFQIIGQ